MGTPVVRLPGKKIRRLRRRGGGVLFRLEGGGYVFGLEGGGIQHDTESDVNNSEFLKIHFSNMPEDI